MLDIILHQNYINRFVRMVFVFIVIGWLVLSNAAYVFAVTLTVEAPQEPLVRGQTFDFKVNIDTNGESITRQEMYVTYETQYVQFVDGGFLAGDFFDSVSYSKVEEGKLYVIGENSAPKSGSGLVAVMKLKIIATAPGTSNLCAVIPITPSGTPAPTNPAAPPTAVPTALPRTGSVDSFILYGALGAGLLSATFVLRKIS